MAQCILPALVPTERHMQPVCSLPTTAKNMSDVDTGAISCLPSTTAVMMSLESTQAQTTSCRKHSKHGTLLPTDVWAKKVLAPHITQIGLQLWWYWSCLEHSVSKSMQAYLWTREACWGNLMQQPPVVRSHVLYCVGAIEVRCLGPKPQQKVCLVWTRLNGSALMKQAPLLPALLGRTHDDHQTIDKPSLGS